MENVTPVAETPAQPALSNALTCLAIGTLIAAAFFYIVAQSSFGDLGRSDAAGNAMARGIAGLSEMALWAALIAFVAMACKGAKLPPDLLWTAGILAVGGTIACNLAVMLISLDGQGWLWMTPTLVPPLTALFAIWARVGLEFSTRTRRIVAYALAVPALALMVPAFIAQQRYEAAAPEREAERLRLEAEYRRGEAEAAAAYEAEFRAKGPDSRIDDFLEYRSGRFEEEALAQIRNLRTRQADATRLMGGDTRFHELERLHEFNVEATPELCAAYRDALDRRLARFVPANPQYRGVPGELEGQQANFRWFMSNGCDLAPQAARLAAAIRSLLPNHYFPRYVEEMEAIARGGAARREE